MAEQAASALASLGVRRGSKVATLLPNSAEILDVWCAAALPAWCSRGDDPGARPEQHAVAGRVPGERDAPNWHYGAIGIPNSYLDSRHSYSICGLLRGKATYR